MLHPTNGLRREYIARIPLRVCVCVCVSFEGTLFTLVRDVKNKLPSPPPLTPYLDKQTLVVCAFAAWRFNKVNCSLPLLQLTRPSKKSSTTQA